MATKVTFQVFSVDKIPVKLPAKLGDGTPVEATVEATRIQLVPADNDAHSTISLLLTGGDAIDAQSTFEVGGTIEATFSKE